MKSTKEIINETIRALLNEAENDLIDAAIFENDGADSAVVAGLRGMADGKDIAVSRLRAVLPLV